MLGLKQPNIFMPMNLHLELIIGGFQIRSLGGNILQGGLLHGNVTSDSFPFCSFQGEPMVGDVCIKMGLFFFTERCFCGEARNILVSAANGLQCLNLHPRRVYPLVGGVEFCELFHGISCRFEGRWFGKHEVSHECIQIPQRLR